MNEREKKLIFILFGAAFLIANVFAFTTYQKAMARKQIELTRKTQDYEKKMEELDKADSRLEERRWLENHAPKEGTHAEVRAELVTFTEQSAGRRQVKLKRRPELLSADTKQDGAYRSASIKVIANAEDKQLYSWLADLQDPEKSRTITSLRITPQRDDPTRVDCVLEVASWFTPKSEEEEVAVSN